MPGVVVTQVQAHIYSVLWISTSDDVFLQCFSNVFQSVMLVPLSSFSFPSQNSGVTMILAVKGCYQLFNNNQCFKIMYISEYHI